MPPSRTTQRRREKINPIPTKNRRATPNNKTLQQGEILMLVIKTSKLATTMANNDGGRTMTFEPNSPMRYAMSMDIILTTSPKLKNSKG
jgi:hypothetical protein